MYTYTLLYIICINVYQFGKLLNEQEIKPHVGISIRIFIDSTIFVNIMTVSKVYQNEGNALKSRQPLITLAFILKQSSTFVFLFLLKCGWFAVFQMYSKVIHLHICPFPDSFSVLGYSKILNTVPCALVGPCCLFYYSSVYLLIPVPN